MDATLQESTADHVEVLLRQTPRFRLNLDDALDVLRNVSLSPSKEKQMYSRIDKENIVRRKIQTALFPRSEAPRTSLVVKHE